MTLDALISASRLARAAGAVGVDRALAGWRSFPSSPGDLSPEWLSSALARRFPRVRVRRFRILEEHSGTTCRVRVSLDYETPGEGVRPPGRVFLKLTPKAPLQRLFLAATGIGRNELRFYRDVRARLPVRAPELYGLLSLGAERQFVLLLEDVSAGGARLSAVGDRVSLDDARRVIDALARLHAAFWESDRFHRDLHWLPSYETRRRDLPWERFVTGRMIGLARRRFGQQFPPSFHSIAALCSERRDLLERLWSEGARTLVHGDCHVGNLFFESDRVGFFDWQVCARAAGMRDVSYFLCTSLGSTLRRGHERDLIAFYLDALRTRGVAAPSFDEAWRQHRLFALYAWIAAAFTAAAGGGLQAREIAIAGLERATAAASDLESVDCALARPGIRDRRPSPVI
jgi:Ser/Thr protein kinase RdoA (MazF antagonist)